jgi:hypothetical protein
MFKPKFIFGAAIAIAPMFSLLPLAGCEDDPHVGVYAEQEGYVYAPGYYYDEAYWDSFHHWHPRNYYYFDGHRWDHRDVVPHDFVARDRHFDARAAHDGGHSDRDGHDEHER